MPFTFIGYSNNTNDLINSLKDDVETKIQTVKDTVSNDNVLKTTYNIDISNLKQVDSSLNQQIIMSILERKQNDTYITDALKKINNALVAIDEILRTRDKAYPLYIDVNTNNEFEPEIDINLNYDETLVIQNDISNIQVDISKIETV